jgi:phosphate transport system protein
MTKHMQKELLKLRKMLLGLCEIVEESVINSVEAFATRDAELARSVVKYDDDIDRVEIEIEEECLKILALHQPVAIDLRFVITALKMNNDLERVGDQSVKIAYKAKDLSKLPELPVEIDLHPLVEITRQMLRDSLDSLINLDCPLAEKVRTSDDKANELKLQIRDATLEAMAKHPDSIEGIILILGVARSLERISDLATNISEDVIYLVDGEIVRHSRDDD